VYLLNDLLDLADDRQHATKRLRPFAAGTLPVLHGAVGCAVLVISAFSLGLWALPPLFTLCLAMYFGLTLAYSMLLKQLAIVDVVVLAILYTQRIFAGTFAFEVPPTFWLLAFSLFIFFSLALVKRYAELHDARSSCSEGRVRGRGYAPDDLEMVAALGAASGYISVLVLALYVQDKATSALYARPEVLWLVCPLLLFWISRTWLLTHRGEMHDDPVVFAIKDRPSLLVATLFLAIFWLAN
jgi:4-hydroxybenzoate polyprenyltransferase